MAFSLMFVKFRICQRSRWKRNSEEFFKQTVSAKDHHMLCVCNVTLRRVTRYLRSLALITLRCFHLSGYLPEFISIVIDDSRKEILHLKDEGTYLLTFCDHNIQFSGRSAHFFVSTSKYILENSK